MTMAAIILICGACAIVGASLGWLLGYAHGTEAVTNDMAKLGMEIRRDESHWTD
jgi:hydrogenase/urease accessory protein HupE